MSKPQEDAVSEADRVLKSYFSVEKIEKMEDKFVSQDLLVLDTYLLEEK